ncbi:HD domain-containing protein [Curtobacterium sp. 22159]|uniref:HD domain-containing protein n=1 Tax=Curtobacterium sp. 22159 TaxID=3453882 RepID=UPI003F84C1D8
MSTTPSTCSRCGSARVDRVHRCPGPVDPNRALRLTDPAIAVLDVLRGLGTPLVVGGTVRDLLLREAGRPVPHRARTDVDVELHGGPDTPAVADALRDAGFVVVAAGARFEVLKVVHDGTHVDVAVVAGSDALDHAVSASAARRDFTVNAVAWDPAANVILDAVGGVDDAFAGVLRHTSDRFADDPLRVLRAVQFVARSSFAVHPGTIELARSLSDRFPEIARERVWPELRKLTDGDHVAAALDVLHATDWERHFPELAAVRDVPQDPRWHPEGPVHVHLGLSGEAAARACTADGVVGDERVVVVLAAVLHDLGKAGDGTREERDEDGRMRIRSLGHEVTGAVAARALLRRVGAPRVVVETVAGIVREHMVAHSTNGAPPTVAAARRLLRRLGGSLDTARAWARVCEADARGRGAASSRSPAWSWFEVMSGDAVAGRREPLLTGRDLVAAGLVPGPRVRALLAEAADAQDDGAFDDRAAARRWLESRLVSDGTSSA